MASSATPRRRRPGPNHRLADLLESVNWRPETLARKINEVLARQGTRRVHPKTPYRWIKRGETPHAPVPEIVVLLLAEATGSQLDFDAVWPGRSGHSPTFLPANHGLHVPWTHQGLLRLLEGWPHTMLARRKFITLSGAALTGPAWEWMDTPSPADLARTARDGGWVTPEMMTAIDTIVTSARRMDDQHGAAGAEFVSDQFASLSRLLRRASYDTATGQQLCAALAQLAQTAGFMAYESGHDGTAQHWYLTGLHAAQSAGDRAIAASILALMSNQQADAPGRAGDALQLAAAAQKAAEHTPATVQALISARGSLAYAAAGDLTGFHRTRDQSMEALDSGMSGSEPAPRWAEYVTMTELDAITGRGSVTLARHITGRGQRDLLTTAITLLNDRALNPNPAYQRSAVRHAAWLGLAHVHAGNLDQAVTAGRTALQYAPKINSRRCVQLLHDLRDNLTPHARNTNAVRDLVTDLTHGLQPQ